MDETDGSPSLEDCNLILKGGVLSGIVHAGAFGPLSERFRYRGVAGSSAGAIGAALLAAAEYARQGGDPAGFDRLRVQCTALPSRLPQFFQPQPGLEALHAALVHLAPGTGRARFLPALLSFWRPLALGALVGFAALLAIDLTLGLRPAQWGPAAPGLLLAAILGSAIALATTLVRTLGGLLPRAGFAVSTGLGGPHSGPDITDWIHQALQTVAFGPGGRERPLEFRDLASRGVDLRIIATDLSHARRVVLSATEGPSVVPVEAWQRLFPISVVSAFGDVESHVLAEPGALPVLAAVRMSMACPGLLSAVPLIGPRGESLLMVDGGVTQNFPLGLFDDASGALRTMAFDFATLREPIADRVTGVAAGLANHDRPVRLETLLDYGWALMVALREGATRAKMLQSPYREYTYQVWLTPDEGGMALDSTEADARRLMRYGEALAAKVIATMDGEPKE
jgi:predicted acylesterase/phospholipase RssA